jgi:20S proteasome alpha/beta subunit
MTIAIGTLYNDGIIVCADTKAVASDWATTDETKISIFDAEGERGVFVIADAADDAHAARMLADEIGGAVYRAVHPADPGPEIKSVMSDWYRAYGVQKPPGIEFLLGCVIPARGPDQECVIFRCEPPATVVENYAPVVIGQGARAVAPILSLLSAITEYDTANDIPHNDLRMSLIRLAFMMYRAKRDEGSFCGGDTETIVVPKSRRFIGLTKEEMKAAEELARKTDLLQLKMHEMITTGVPLPNLRLDWVRQYENLTAESRELQFPSLKRLE